MEKLTREQAAIIGAYTGYLCGSFVDMSNYIEKILGRPVWTHELASEELQSEIKRKSKNDFLKICAEE